MILIDHNGYIHVAYIGYDQKIPRKNITAFRTDIKTHDMVSNYAELKDIAVQSEHRHYRITRIGARYDQSLVLETCGENNIMIYENVPCPKVRAGIKTRWNGDEGQWEKELKSGWCMA